MPRVHFVKKARKDNPAVKAGESYYWWKFRYGGKQFSKKRPRPSQLTQSDKKSRALAAQERIEDATSSWSCNADQDELREVIGSMRATAEVLESVVGDLREIADEYNESADNIEQNFSYSQTAEDCREKADALESSADDIDNYKNDLESAIDTLEEIDGDLTNYDSDDDEDESEIDGIASRITDACNEAETAVGSCEVEMY